MCRGIPGWLNGAMQRLAWRMCGVWMLAFATLHVYWGFGGTALLPDGVSVLDSPAMFVIDLVAIPLCLAGAALAWLLRPDQHPRRLLTRRWLIWPGTVGAAVMLAHGVTGLAVVAVPWLVSGEVAREERWSLLYEPYWLLGGLLLAATVTSYRRAVRRAQSLQRKRRDASAVAATPQTAITSHSPSSA